ncbi:hypothetical protein [Clostridium botulinum]|nr:hypothetical protein [Clostridium botulinum]
MGFLHEKVFNPIINSTTVSPKIESGVNLIMGRMNRLSLEKMV